MENKLSSEEMKAALEQMGALARTASRKLAAASTEEKNQWLTAMADAIDAQAEQLMSANALDMEAGSAAGLSAAMLDRLKLDSKRIRGISDGLRHVATLPDPVGRTLEKFTRPNGLEIEKVSVPIGVIAIIYESRPNVTVDATGLCLKAGNAVILRGGSEAIRSNLALARCIAEAGERAGNAERNHSDDSLDRTRSGLPDAENESVY